MASMALIVEVWEVQVGSIELKMALKEVAGTCCGIASVCSILVFSLFADKVDGSFDTTGWHCGFDAKGSYGYVQNTY